MEIYQSVAPDRGSPPRLELCALELPIGKAIPCALAASELISNAYKHAAPDRAGAAVRITLSAEGAARGSSSRTKEGASRPASTP
jgi:two-component sensor histidine kinase